MIFSNEFNQQIFPKYKQKSNLNHSNTGQDKARWAAGWMDGWIKLILHQTRNHVPFCIHYAPKLITVFFVPWSSYQTAHKRVKWPTTVTFLLQWPPLNRWVKTVSLFPNSSSTYSWFYCLAFFFSSYFLSRLCFVYQWIVDSAMTLLFSIGKLSLSCFSAESIFLALPLAGPVFITVGRTEEIKDAYFDRFICKTLSPC